MPVKHNTHVDLSNDMRANDTREKIVEILDARLADAIDLMVQAKSAHWNVRGKHFMSLHLLFDKLVDMAQESADEIAERIGQLGGFTKANIQQTARTTSLPEFNMDLSDGEEMIVAITKTLAAFANHCRKSIDETADLGDQASADILTEIVRSTDKNLWFVEAHLQ